MAMKKLLAMVLCLVMVFSFAACGNKGGKGDAEGSAVTKENIKVGFIFLHDENSTYDKNFMEAANEAKKALGLI